VKIVDTHTHIYSEEFDEDLAEIISRAKKSGVEKILLPNIDVESLERLHRVSDTYSGYCLPMMGLHPTSVNTDWENQLEIIRKQFDNRSYIAVGEIGIDLYWDQTFKDEQTRAFEEQLRWSIEYNLPVSIHTRNATMECIESIKNIGVGHLRGVFHSFGGNSEELKQILSLNNFLLGINGVVTFKNSTLPSVLKETDLSHLVIETDAPYLTPAPFRGKRNEVSYTTYIVEKLAEIYNVEANVVGEITTENAAKMFALQK